MADKIRAKDTNLFYKLKIRLFPLADDKDVLGNFTDCCGKNPHTVWGLPFSPQMFKCPEGMMPQHSGACISHHLFYFLFHLWAIAMNWTLTAGFLPFSERTMRQPLVGIVQQFLAVFAKDGVSFFVPAIKPNHLFYRLFFFFSS